MRTSRTDKNRVGECPRRAGTRRPAARLVGTSLLALTFVAAPGAAQRLPFRSYTSDDGLAQSVVTAMVQDASGYLWLGTPAGLSRFDGLVFVNFSESHGLVDATIRALLTDREGTVWIGTDGGLARYRDGRFDDPGTPLGLPSTSVRALVDDGDGGLWVGTYGDGAYHVSGGRVVHFGVREGLAHDRVRAALRDPSGRVWLGTYGGGLTVVEEDGGLRSVGAAEGLGDPYVRALLVDADGRLLVATNGGLFAGDAEGRRFAPHLGDQPRARSALSALLLDRRGRLWIGTRDTGLCRWDGASMECWQTPQGLADDSVNTLLEDHEGNVWIGTFAGGVSRLSTESFLNYTVRDGLPVASVVAFTQAADGTLWIGTHGGGLTRLVDGRLATLSTRDGLPHDKVVSALDDGTGELWFGTLDGAFELAREGSPRVVREAEGLPSTTVLDVARDHDGWLWFATLQGVAADRPDGSRMTLGTADGLPAERVNTVLPARSGGVWLGTADGLVRWADGRIVAQYTKADGLPDGYVIALLEARDGTLWAGTGGGLSRLGPDGRFTTYTAADGLSHDNTTAILEDDHGKLWVGTTGGISVFDGEGFTVFRSNDGLASGEVNARAAFRDRDGRLWFGTVQGAVVFQPDAVSPAPVPPPIHVTRVTVGGADVPTSGGALDLGPRQNDLRFEFVGISLAYPGDVGYEYRLEGLDGRWRRTRSRFADYPALPPGDYTFRVRAEGRGGVWSAETASFAFAIAPPFWQRAWFQVLGGALLLALGLVAHRFRVRAIQEHNASLVQMVEERERAEAEVRRYARELEHTSLHDTLTDLPNRALFHDRLEVATAQALRRPERGFGVLFIDLDRFKLINDSHGHGFGDRLLVECAGRLRSAVRPSDTVARLGGDEFTVLLADIEGATDATRLAERIQRTLGAAYRIDDHEVVVTASIGIALGSGGVQVDDLLRDADTAMYRAKALGRGQCAVFDPVMHARAVEQLRLENDLRRAIQREELLLYYQPIRSLHTGEVAACEALLRWDHPTKGVLTPGSFLVHADETGLGGPIGEWVLREACRQAAQWRARLGRRAVATVSVNLFNRQVTQRDLADRLGRALEESGLPPEDLHLEITEDVLIEEPETAVAVLSEVKKMKVRIFLDDFGTGFSSLSYLQRFPVDVLKIDRSFIGRLEGRDNSRKMVESILHLARNLGIEVIAEGVETAIQLARLEDLGCDYAQGYLISRPLAPVAAERYLATHLPAEPPIRVSV